MIFNTISDLRLSAGTGADIYAEVLGYYLPGDGGGGSFYWDAVSAEQDNGGTVFQVTGVSGRWKRIISDCIEAPWFGAKGDGANDDTGNIQNAINFLSDVSNTIDFMNRTYVVDQLNLKSNIKLKNGSLINVKQITGNSILKGKDLSNIALSYITFKGIILSTTTPGYNITDRCINIENCNNVEIDHCFFIKKVSGIYLTHCTDIIIKHSSFLNNITTGLSGHCNNLIVQNCIFFQNGRPANGQTHDLYLLNSTDVLIENNIFNEHKDAASYNLVIRYDENETENFTDTKRITVKNNMLFGLGVLFTSSFNAGNLRKPVKDINFQENKIIGGGLKASCTYCFNSNNNFMDTLIITNTSTYPGYKMTFSSINDTIGRIYSSIISAHFGIDVKNVQIRFPKITTNDIIVNREMSTGGQPELTLIEPTVINTPSAWLDSASLARLNLGNIVIVRNTIEMRGISSDKPLHCDKGALYFDVSIKKPLWWDGTNWVDSTGTAV